GYVARFGMSTPLNGKVEIAGPERFKMYEIVDRYLQHSNDSRKVIPNGRPEYFGGEITHSALVPAGQDVQLGAINFEKWLTYQLQNA
ncbi:MAG: NmrA family transcriptional regulator, partial [Chitinophagaceae bacterium]|nr:NmrA family transcriptional regulator [Chitinophagaceae bacterium]